MDSDGTDESSRARHPAGSHIGDSQPTLRSVPTEPVEESPVFVKHPTAGDPTRRQTEADILRVLRHPGVVEVVSVEERPDGTELRLAQVPDAVDLLHHEVLTPCEMAEIFGQICQTLSDIHAAGFVHGNLGAEHILVDTNLRVVLCGFGNTSPIRSESRPDGLDPALDVIAAGRLLDRELERLDDNIEDSLLTSLRHIASLAEAHQVTKATAASLALRLHQMSNAAPTESSTADHDHSTKTGWRQLLNDHHTLVASSIAAAIVFTFVFVAFGWLTRPDDVAADETQTTTTDMAPNPRSAATPEDDIPARSSGAELVFATPALCLDSAGARNSGPETNLADLDGDGCLETWSAASGVLTADGQRYALGSTGDLVTVGDWNCDGVATPALVHSSGEVFLFPLWPENGDSINVRASSSVASPVAVEATQCGSLRIESADGTLTIVDNRSEGSQP